MAAGGWTHIETSSSDVYLKMQEQHMKLDHLESKEQPKMIDYASPAHPQR